MAGKPHPRERVTQPQDQSIRHIALTQKKVAVVDAEDYDRINAHIWYAFWAPNAKTFYAGRCTPGDRKVRIKMHQEVLGAIGDNEPDHENHNGLDNRKQNLRPATEAQNSAHRRKFSSSKSRFKGVHAVEGGFVARIQFDGTRLYLGYFVVEEDAARAYDARAVEFHGTFAVLNFPGEFARVA